MHDRVGPNCVLALIHKAFKVFKKPNYGIHLSHKCKKCLPRWVDLGYTHCELSFHLSVLCKKAHNYNLTK